MQDSLVGRWLAFTAPPFQAAGFVKLISVLPEPPSVTVFSRRERYVPNDRPFVLEGRNATLVRMKLPAGFSKIAPADVIIRYRDMLGVERIRCGDPRMKLPLDLKLPK